jgi:hypothetical protein
MNKRKLEDRILNLAFEGNSEQDRQELEALLATHPDLKEDYQSSADIKQALLDLREVPECQLSNESLRDAILARQLTKKETRRPWLAGSAIVTSAAAITALLIVLSSENPTAGDASIGAAESLVASHSSDAEENSGEGMVSESEVIEESPTVVENATVPETDVASEMTSVPTPERASPGSTSNNRRQETPEPEPASPAPDNTPPAERVVARNSQPQPMSPEAPLEAETRSADELGVAEAAGASSIETEPSGTEAIVAEADLEQADSEVIMMVGANTNDVTGARTAVALDNSDYVVFGG